MIVTAITSIMSFVGTNIDNIFILMFLFTQVDDDFIISNVVIGQFVGMGALVGMSLLGAFGLNFISREFSGLLGVIPIILGIKALLEYRKGETDGLRTEDSKNTNSIIFIVLVMIANGADNLCVYIPLFADYSGVQIAMAVFIFALMTALWCLMGYKLANYPVIKGKILRYKHVVVPLVLVVLGIYIIIKSGVVGALF